MFKALEIGSTIEIDPRHLSALVRSSNTRELALGGGPKRPTRAYTLSFFDGDRNTYRVYVYLARAQPDAPGRTPGLLFRSEPADVDLAGYQELQAEAGTMVKSQGFEMEVVELGALSPPDRADLLAALPFAETALVPAPPVSEPSAPTQLDSVEATDVGSVSRAITLPETRAVSVLGRLLSLF